MTGVAAAGRDVRVPPRRHSALRIGLCALLQRGLRALGGRFLYRRLHLAPGRFELRRETVRVAGLPASLDGYLVAQLSDVHAGAFVGPGDLRHVVDAVRAEAPDLVVLTGDVITSHWRESLLVRDDLARLEPPDGAFGVFGNHDYHDREEGRIVAAYAEVGWTFLRDETARVERGDGALAIVGLEDLEEAKRVDLEAARRGVRDGDVELVLCHNPEGARVVAREQCAAVLSGHTHGGQIVLPFGPPLGPPHPGDRRDLGTTAAITSRGLGALVLPFRRGAPAEVVLIRLEAAEGDRRAR